MALAVGLGVLAAEAPPVIRWPTPSRPPGTVTVTSRYPTETAWNPVLARFARDRGDAFAEMHRAARRYAESAHPAPKADPAAEPVSAGSTPSSAALLRAIDIARLPVLPVKDMVPHTARLRSQLEALRPGGFGRAVWEVTDLPTDGDLQAWTDACLAAFPRPPVLMLGWHLSGAEIAPLHDSSVRFLELCAPRCHSVMITGEQLNTQFYAEPDGGLAVPHLRYWIGVLRSRAPGAFLWCRIDEMVSSQRPNERQEVWTRELLPLCDGLVYQANHGARDVAGDRMISEQFQAVSRAVARMSDAGVHPPRQGRGALWPVLLGGFSVARSAHPVLGAFGAEGMKAELQAYETWLAARRYVGYIRYVGVLPTAPAAELLACSLASAAPPEAQTVGEPPPPVGEPAAKPADREMERRP